MTTVFGLISDFHVGVPRKHPVTKEPVTHGTLTSIKEALSRLESKPTEFVVQLGDLFQENPDAPSHSEESKKLADSMEIFGQHPCPVYHVVGNHDTAVLSEHELQEGFGYEKLYYSFESQEFTNLVLYSRTPELKNAHIPEEELTWLSDELKKSQKPVLVFIHHPLVERPLEDTFWFKGIPEYAFIHHSETLRTLLEGSGKVAAVFNGHMHSNDFHVVNNIPYFTIQSFIEDAKDNGVAAEAFATVTIDQSRITTRIEGVYPVTYTHERTPLQLASNH